MAQAPINNSVGESSSVGVADYPQPLNGQLDVAATEATERLYERLKVAAIEATKIYFAHPDKEQIAIMQALSSRLTDAEKNEISLAAPDRDLQNQLLSKFNLDSYVSGS